MDSILEKFEKIQWRYATGDSEALSKLEERIAEAGRKRSLITYSDLVRDVTFNLPNLRKPRTIDVTDWQELDRAIVGDFLGYISMRSYERASDEKAEVVKILNNGNVKGFPVLRSESDGKREFNPKACHVFGPKLVATRGFFDDKALESRFLTEEMGQYRLRDDVPINQPSTWKEEALHIRNKLLLFRFRNLNKRKPAEHLVDRSIEPRLNQIFVPLLSIIEDPGARHDLQELAKRYNREMISDRGMDMEAQILEIIRDTLASQYGGSRLPVKDITRWFVDRHGMDYERKITSKWIGTIIRKRLNLKTERTRDGYVILPSELEKLERLYERYGISGKDSQDDDIP